MKYLSNFDNYKTNEQVLSKIGKYAKSLVKSGSSMIDNLMKRFKSVPEQPKPKTDGVTAYKPSPSVIKPIFTEQQAYKKLAEFEARMAKDFKMETGEFFMENFKIADPRQWNWKGGTTPKNWTGNVFCDDRGLYVLFQQGEMRSVPGTRVYLSELEELMTEVKNKKIGLSDIEQVFNKKKLITGEDFTESLTKAMRAPHFRGAQAPGWEAGKGSGKYGE